jgi:hypothetical protein
LLTCHFLIGSQIGRKKKKRKITKNIFFLTIKLHPFGLLQEVQVLSCWSQLDQLDNLR